MAKKIVNREEARGSFCLTPGSMEMGSNISQLTQTGTFMLSFNDLMIPVNFSGHPSLRRMLQSIGLCTVSKINWWEALSEIKLLLSALPLVLSGRKDHIYCTSIRPKATLRHWHKCLVQYSPTIAGKVPLQRFCQQPTMRSHDNYHKCLWYPYYIKKLERRSSTLVKFRFKSALWKIILDSNPNITSTLWPTISATIPLFWDAFSVFIILIATIISPWVGK